MNPAIYRTEPKYFRQLLSYHDVDYVPVANSTDQLYINGFDDYNNLVRLNGIFSNSPSGDVIDRTQRTVMPFNMAVLRPWVQPTSYSTLAEVFAARVRELEANLVVNVLWSGGIDSTAIVAAVLQNCSTAHYRILYTQESIKEHPKFYSLLSNTDLELVELTESSFRIQNFDGVFVTGAGGDGLTASLDQSFFDTVSYTGLHGTWQDYFKTQALDAKFMQFCEEFFAGYSSLLAARWWYYTNCKLQKFPAAANSLLNDAQPLAVGFFDCIEFEHYNYFNIDKIVTGDTYSSYKQEIKDYILAFDCDKEYYTNKEKKTSLNLSHWRSKKQIIDFTDYILLLESGERIRTPNLPFLNKQEYRNTFQNRLDYLFTK